MRYSEPREKSAFHLFHSMSRFPLVLLLWLWLTAAGTALATEPAPALRVFVSILPQVEFVRRVGGDRVQVQPLVLPGQSPETYSPTPKQMADLGRARVYFRIGVPFEYSLVPRLAAINPGLSIIDLRQSLDLIRDRKDQDEPDPHIWLDPALAARMAATIRDTLIALDPEGRDGYRQRCTAFQRDLARLDNDLRTMLAPFRGRTLLVFHPAYGYFCRAYGIRQLAIVREGKRPGPRQLARLIDQIRTEGIAAIVVQPQFSRKNAAALARATGARLVNLDPLAENYLDNMRTIGREISRILRSHPSLRQP